MSNEQTPVRAESRVNFHKFGNVIDGKVTSTTEYTQTKNPSTLELNPNVPISTQRDVNNAVSAARAGLVVWANTPLENRRASVLRYVDAIEVQKAEFAEMPVKEQGKPLRAATAEIEESINVLRDLAVHTFWEKVIQDEETRRVVSRYVPIGVCVGIVPWNFSISSISYKLGPALIAGCVMIIKPSSVPRCVFIWGVPLLTLEHHNPFTPYCGLKLAELGPPFFPPGVIQALSGNDDLGPWLTTYPGVDKVSFTGSIQTGKKVVESCRKSLKRVTLELGGNDLDIICSDINIPSVAAALTGTALYNSGQVCITAKRVYVHASIFAEFVDAMASVCQVLKIGDGFSQDTFNGPLQNNLQYQRVKALQNSINKDNLQIKTCSPTTVPTTGLFIAPMIVINPPDDSDIVTKEQFGPIIPVMKWTDESEVVLRANNSNMGLGASVWSCDLVRAECRGRSMNSGNVWINTQVGLQPNAPFSRHKGSGIGVELGLEGIKSYSNVQTMYLNPSYA